MNRHLYTIFAVLVAALLVTLGLIISKEADPEWKRYQRAFYDREVQKVTAALAAADQVQRSALEKRLRYLERPSYGIRQILLKDGAGVERCITCHLDSKQLEKKHPQIERYPFEEYGCTVCHGGVGRATESSMAHSTLRIPRRPLYEYLQVRQTQHSTLDLFRYSASGEPIAYTGPELCLRCHLGSHPKHVARWRGIKFKPFDKVAGAKLKDLRKKGLQLDEQSCLGCHTTGFDELTGRYLEDRVTCESCHGPGEFYADLMAGGRAREGAELARVNILKTSSEKVCLNCHRPNRHRDYEGEDTPPTLIAANLGQKQGPQLDGTAAEKVWSMAPAIKIPTWQFNDGTPQPGAEVVMRALYNQNRIYFSFQWTDKESQSGMGRWLLTDGKWRTEIKWPDALALHWPATAQVKDFKQGGCAVLCHSGGRFKNFPRMATRQQGAVVDEWYWNAFTADIAGRPGDGFLDHQEEFIPQGKAKPMIRWAHPEIYAAHGSDTSGERRPGTVGGVRFTLNTITSEGKPPLPRFYLEGGRQLPLDLSDLAGAAGKNVPLYGTGEPEEGDSADVQGKAIWSDGYWTLELSRALKTSGKHDVQLDPSEKNLAFGLAVWDGTTADQHQVATIVRLHFESLKE